MNTIQENTHIPRALRFWVNMCSIHLHGCSLFNVMISQIPSWSKNDIRVWFDVNDFLYGMSFWQWWSNDVSSWCGANNGAIVCGWKNFNLREHTQMNGWTHTWGGCWYVICKSSPLDEKVDIEHYISEMIDISNVLRFWIRYCVQYSCVIALSLMWWSLRPPRDYVCSQVHVNLQTQLPNPFRFRSN